MGLFGMGKGRDGGGRVSVTVGTPDGSENRILCRIALVCATDGRDLSAQLAGYPDPAGAKECLRGALEAFKSGASSVGMTTEEAAMAARDAVGQVYGEAPAAPAPGARDGIPREDVEAAVKRVVDLVGRGFPCEGADVGERLRWELFLVAAGASIMADALLAGLSDDDADATRAALTSFLAGKLFDRVSRGSEGTSGATRGEGERDGD